MKKSILLGLTATLLTFGPLVAAAKPQSKATKPPSSQSSQPMQKQQPGTVTQSATTTKSSTNMSTSKTHKLYGTVDSISGDQLSITTKSGKKDTFDVGSVKNASLAKAGDHVTVWYRESNGEKTATKVAVNHGSASTKGSKTSGTSAANSKAKTPSSPPTAHH